jgi:hypothetical protein
MSQERRVWWTARTGTFEEFVAIYLQEDATEKWQGMSLALHALCNPVPDARYRITNLVMDDGAPVDGVGFGGHGLFTTLFEQWEHDLDQTLHLIKRLAAGGADPGRVDGAGRIPSHNLVQWKFTDVELAPLYDFWFSLPHLNLTHVNRSGRTPLDMARDLSPHRDDLVARMEAYLERFS